MDRRSIINFGQFKGQTIQEIWTGQMEQPFSETEAIRNYLKEFFDYIAGERPIKIIIPANSPGLEECNVDLKIFRSYLSPIDDISIVVTDHYLIVDSDDTRIRIAMMNIFCALLGSDFRNISGKFYWTSPTEGKNRLTKSENSTRFHRIQGNPNYLRWCLDTISDFYIEPSELEDLISMNVRFIDTFKVKPVNNNLVEYKPIWKEFTCGIPDKTKTLNMKKFEKLSMFHAIGADEQLDAMNYSEDEDLTEDSIEDSSYCGACSESPCMCSDPERTSTLW